MEVRKGYKQTEIGIFPNDWEIKKIGDVAELFGRIGFRGYTVNDIVKEGYGAITISPSNMQNETINFKKCTYISWFKYEESPEIKIYNGDILLVKTGSTFGKSALVENLNEKATINPQIVVFKKLKINNILLSKIISNPIVQEQINSSIVGGAIPTLSQRLVLNFKIPLPPTLQEQNAIANALSDTDTWINSLEQLLAKKRQIKQGAMQELLQPKEGWELKKLGEILNYIQPTPYLVTDTEYSNDFSIPVLTAGKTFLLGYTSEEFGIFDDLPTIIFDDFTTAIQFVDFPFKAKSSAMKMLVLKDKSNNLKLMFEIIKNIKYPLGDHKRHWIGEYSKIEIKLPKPEEQTRIATILSDMDEEIAQLETKLAKAKQIKQGMMQELLTGRIRLV